MPECQCMNPPFFYLDFESTSLGDVAARPVVSNHADDSLVLKRVETFLRN